MKNWILMAICIAVFASLPSQGTELGELHPVSLLVAQTEGKSIHLLTDTGDRGEGETVEAALRNLEDTTPGHLFLDTVQYLVVTEQTRYLIPQLKEMLRPGVLVCLTESQIDPEAVPAFLTTHQPENRLSDTNELTPLQKLTCTEERYILE